MGTYAHPTVCYLLLNFDSFIECNRWIKNIKDLVWGHLLTCHQFKYQLRRHAIYLLLLHVYHLCSVILVIIIYKVLSWSFIYLSYSSFLPGSHEVWESSSDLQKVSGCGRCYAHSGKFFYSCMHVILAIFFSFLRKSQNM